MSHLTDSLAQAQLKPSTASVLLFLSEMPNSSQSTIGAALGIKSANMTPIIALLESQQLCSRQALDGRTFGIRLTRSGEKLASQVREIIEAHEQKCFAHLDPSQQTALKKMLASIHDELG